MIVSKASRRYARALYDLAKVEGCLDPVLVDMGVIGAAVPSSPELGGFLSNYVVRRKDRLMALEGIFKAGASPLSWRFLLFLESKRRMGLLPDICQAISELHDRMRGVVHVALTTAFPMEAADERAISGSIASRISGPMKLGSSVDQDLMGGFVFRVGDTVYDYSVKGTLQALRDKLVGSR